MKFVVIFGPPAVGKMTVGFELSRLTGLKLFHNHMTIDLVSNFFDHDSPHFRLNTDIRYRIFEEISKSDLSGLIFTFVWNLDNKSAKTFVDKSCAYFSQRGADVYFIELYADLSERLKRNKTEFRLSQKKPKRDLDRSKKQLLSKQQHSVMNSNNDFFYPDNHLKIDNTSLSATQVAQIIAAHCELSMCEQI